MSLENLSTGKKKAIVVVALLVIIGLKIYGFIETKPALIVIIALAIVASVTDAKPLAAAEITKTTPPESGDVSFKNYGPQQPFQNQGPMDPNATPAEPVDDLSMIAQGG